MQTLRHVKDVILRRINMHPAAIEGEQLATLCTRHHTVSYMILHNMSHDIT